MMQFLSKVKEGAIYKNILQSKENASRYFLKASYLYLFVKPKPE